MPIERRQIAALIDILFTCSNGFAWFLIRAEVIVTVTGAGAAPIIFALLSDIYPPDQRVFVSTLVLFSTGAGALIGQAIAGMSGLDWRLPFAIIAVPSVAMATLMVLTTQDPRLGAAEPALQDAFTDETFQYDERLTWPKFRRLICVPTNFLVIGQVHFPQQVLLLWLTYCHTSWH